ISIQSETVERRPPLPCTAPASLIMRACSASASVIVDLPASGWEMIAKVRRRFTSRAMVPADAADEPSELTRPRYRPGGLPGKTSGPVPTVTYRTRRPAQGVAGAVRSHLGQTSE